MIAIIDYGAGNLVSVKKAFAYLGAEVVVTNQPATVASADRIVFPGVGHFSALQALDQSGLRESMLQAAYAATPILGVCLGMQWLFEGSEECPAIAGSAIFQGKCAQFPPSVKSPHVGWNSLAIQDGSRLLKGIPQNTFVYYTHSFYAPVITASTAISEYGLQFTAAVERQNIFGVQFHPEKSGEAGLAILNNFCEI